MQCLWQASKIDFSALTGQEAQRVTRYALSELNGFSDWLPELAAAQPQIVRQVFGASIRGEWEAAPDRDRHPEVLSNLAAYGERYWPLVAEDLRERLRSSDPEDPRVTEYALSILLRSQSPPHSQLCRLASERVIGQRSGSEFLINWLVVWLQIDAVAAVDFLSRYVRGLAATEADALVIRLCHGLKENRLIRLPPPANPDYLQPDAIRVWAPLVYRHIRESEDIHRPSGMAFSPIVRDEAQEFRNSLLGRLAQVDAPNVLQTLEELAEVPELASHKDYIRHLARQRLERDLDLAPWHARDIRAFATDFETDPRSDTELYEIARWRFQDIRREVEFAENSLREEVQESWDEFSLRRWLQRKLRDRSRGHYAIPQEAEIDQQQRPDLRFENPSMRGAISVEIKWSQNWSARELLEGLEDQLVGQYMRAHEDRYGIYVLGLIGGERHWNHPSGGARLGFAELVKMVAERADQIEQQNPGVSGIFVIGLDFRVPDL